MTPPSTRCRKGCSPEDVLQHSDGTAVTPRVSAIAERLFLQSLHTVKMSVSPEHAALPEASSCLVHPTVPQSAKWAGSARSPHIFQSIIIDGTTYTVLLQSEAVRILILHIGW